MWKTIAIFTWAALMFIGAGYVWLVTTSTAEANIYLYPTGNGAVQEWNVAPTGSSHYTTVDDNVIQPAIPDSSNYLYVGSAGSGTEIEDLVFRVSSKIGGITKVTVWLYGENLGCVGGGQNNCDSITLSLPDYGKTIGTFTPPGGKRGWMSKSTTFAEPFYLPQNFDNDVVLRLQRTAVGGGSNKDTMALAAIYVQFTVTSENKDPAPAEKEVANDPPRLGAILRKGNHIPEIVERLADDAARDTATNAGGGSDAD